MPFVWELRTVVFLVFVALIAPSTGRSVTAYIARPFRRLALHRQASIVFVALTSFIATASLAWAVGMPRPYIHDEFAYVLAADTFAHGRVTNPTHPMWEHFESHHIIHNPCYQSKYPPAQGLVMAFGQVTTGHQIVGVWFSLACACGATCWMLQGWTRPRWALLGGLIMAVHPNLILRWGETYWGGAVAMLGGALVLGAYPRLSRGRESALVSAACLGVGAVLLANSRPYEGLVLCIPVAIVLASRVLTRGAEDTPNGMLRSLLISCVVVAAGAGLSVYYNYRVTGAPLTLPYQVWMQQYANNMSLSGLLWQVKNDTARTRETRPHVMAGSLPPEATADDIRRDRDSRPFVKPLRHILFFFTPALLLPVLFLPRALLSGRTRLPAVCYVLVLIAVLSNSCSGHSHYYAPATAAICLLLVDGFRRMRIWRVGKRQWGRVLAGPLLLVPLVSTVMLFWTASPGFVPPWAEWVKRRSQIEQELTERGGKHLVLVRYQAGHNFDVEWVYNGADLDGSRILWARPFNGRRLEMLIEQMSDRTVWVLDADTPRRELIPYSPDVSNLQDVVATAAQYERE